MREREAFEVVESVLRIAEIIRAERARIAANPGTDATAFAGHLAAALLAAGGRLPDGNEHRLRHPIAETPLPAADREGYAAALALVDVLAGCLRRGPGPDHRLELAARVWPEHENKASADAAVMSLERARADAEAQRVREEHEKRLAAAPKTHQLPSPASVVVPDRAFEPMLEGEFAIDDERLLGVQ